MLLLPPPGTIINAQLALNYYFMVCIIKKSIDLKSIICQKAGIALARLSLKIKHFVSCQNVHLAFPKVI